MKQPAFADKLKTLQARYEEFVTRPNPVDKGWYNGVFDRYEHPILTADHVPLEWRFDLNPVSNPHLLERQGVNAALNSGAIEHNGATLLCVRLEGYDRKSFFAIAESANGVDNFRFWDEPVDLPETDNPDTNVYDMRLVKHEDGWIYGTFCTERKDTSVPAHDTSTATAQCGIVRTHDFKHWERLHDLKSPSSQQRNVVLHPEFVNGKYALYTRPQDGFFDTGKGAGIGWGLSDSMEKAVIAEEVIIEPRKYHTIKEMKNGQGPAPLKTPKGWLHMAHGVRNTAAGFRYVLYLFLSDLKTPSKIIASPGGYFLAPWAKERVGDVSNVVFTNGWVLRSDGSVFIYYASSDTRMHVATSTLDKLLDYVLHTPEDLLTTRGSLETRLALIRKNRSLKG